MTKIEVENVLQPGKTYRVDALKFNGMRRAMLSVLPSVAPGMTPSDVVAAVKPLLDQGLFPGGEKAGWWVKAVQLDQEAKGVIRRSDKAPVRLFKSQNDV